MTYKVNYTTRRGGGMTKIVPDIKQVEVEIRRLFSSRTEAKAYCNNIVIGEVYKRDKRWNWYLDTDA